MESFRPATHQPLATGKENISVSEMIRLPNPEQRKFKECIGDGSVDDNNSSCQVQEDEIRVLQEKFNMTEFRAKLRVAEALAQAHDMTSPAAKRRLEARKIEMDMSKEQDDGKPVFLNENNEEYTPPKELLIYIMR